jgi:hypothetical protein
MIGMLSVVPQGWGAEQRAPGTPCAERAAARSVSPAPRRHAVRFRTGGRAPSRLVGADDEAPRPLGVESSGGAHSGRHMTQPALVHAREAPLGSPATGTTRVARALDSPRNEAPVIGTTPGHPTRSPAGAVRACRARRQSHDRSTTCSPGIVRSRFRLIGRCETSCPGSAGQSGTDRSRANEKDIASLTAQGGQSGRCLSTDSQGRSSPPTPPATPHGIDPHRGADEERHTWRTEW